MRRRPLPLKGLPCVRKSVNLRHSRFALWTGGQAAGFIPFSAAPIHYRSENLDDPIARLLKRLDYGQLRLDYDPKSSYLTSIMAALAVPVSSQTLVFSKT